VQMTSFAGIVLVPLRQKRLGGTARAALAATGSFKETCANHLTAVHH
jgi:hypothetical protein